MCAGGEKDKDSCGGDSGSALMKMDKRKSKQITYSYILIGIVSYGPKLCGKQHHTAVYTKVRGYKNWILESLRKCIV